MREVCTMHDCRSGRTFTVAAIFDRHGLGPITLQLLEKGVYVGESFPYEPDLHLVEDPLQRAAIYKVTQIVYGDPAKDEEDFALILILID